MRFHRRRRQEVTPAASTYTLTASQVGTGDDILPTYRHPELLAPLDFTLTGLPPDEADLKLATTQLITDAVARGALDEGSYAFLDYLIESEVAHWNPLLYEEAEGRRKIAAVLVASDTHNLERANTELRLREAALADAREAERRALQVLRGTDDADPPPVRIDSPEPRELPTGTGAVGRLLAASRNQRMTPAPSDPEEA